MHQWKRKIADNKLNNREYEGLFQNGRLKGECKIYRPDGSLYYTGTVRNFLPDGDGMIYEQNSKKEDVVTEEGEFADGYLVNGSMYITTGKVIASGEFVPDGTHRLKKGFRSLTGQKLCSTMFIWIFNCPVRATSTSPITSRVALTGQLKIHINIVLQSGYL